MTVGGANHELNHGVFAGSFINMFHVVTGGSRQLVFRWSRRVLSLANAATTSDIVPDFAEV